MSYYLSDTTITYPKAYDITIKCLIVYRIQLSNTLKPMI